MNDTEMNSLENLYNIFLKEVQNNTLALAYNAKPTDNQDVFWEIVGVEFQDDTIKQKFGEEVYQLANAEVPATPIENSRLMNRDFEHANRKLGYLIQEGAAATALIDLQMFIDALKEKGIPCYVDYENKAFHYNTTKENARIMNPKIDSLEKLYDIFLKEVQNNTLALAYNAKPTDNQDVVWEIVGIEFQDDTIKQKFGEKVYQLANAEVPATPIENSRLMNRDFEHANRKLGYLIHEGAAATALIDLQMFMDALNEKGIPCYVDYENKAFHYNANKKTFK